LKNSGFTLLEIIVASVIGAFVALTAVASLRAITAGREKIDHNINLAGELRYAADMITNDLTNLYRDSEMQNTKLIGETKTVGRDRTNRLVFYAVNRIAARPGKPEGDVYEIEYYLQKKEQDSALTRRLWPYPDRDQRPGGIITVMAQNIVDFNIRYYDGDEWLEEWSEEMKELPEMVDISLSAKLPEQKSVVSHTFLVNFARWPRKQE